MSSTTLSVPLWVDLCGKAAPLAAVLVFLAPFPTIQQVRRDKLVGELPLLPYSTMISNSFLWTVYGILRKEPKIWSNSAFGFVMGIYYFVQFARFSPKKSATLPGSIRQHVHACLAIILITMYTATFSSLQSPASVIGLAGCTFGVVMFASPLAVLRVTLETKSAKAIPLPFTLASLVNCFLWSVAGLEMKDANVYIPNMLGFCFALIQVGLKLYYGNGVKDHGSSVKESVHLLKVV